jgi:pyrroloquinoline quinone biosynthesis protein E
VFAEAVTDVGLPLTINVVLHRGNLERMRALAVEAIALGARRIELAHAQYYGWGLANRAALMPGRDAVEEARRTVAELREETAGSIVIDYVLPDYFARYPKPCVNGWGRQSLNVTPRGRVLPCHAAESIPDLEFWSVADHSLAEIWLNSPSFNAFRGTGWMRDPCRSCPRNEIDFGGCRCQALALTGDTRNADPVCILSPFHETVTALVEQSQARQEFVMRGRQLQKAQPA